MSNLKLIDYDCVEDIIEEVLEIFCKIKIYYLDDVISCDEEFVCGNINIVKRGKNENHLLHKYNDGTWSEAEISYTYRHAEYYKVSELEKILPNLCKKNYYKG